MSELNEQELIRRQALADLVAMGIDPYPAASFNITHHAHEVVESFESLVQTGETISIAGRMMARRIMGNASFATLQDAHSRVQIYVNRDEICPEEDKTLYNKVFKHLVDLGDIIGITGVVFRTKTGEISVKAKTMVILSKSLRPLPVVKEVDGKLYDAFTDPEQRYRMRYLDLIVNAGNRDIFRKRTKMVNTMRNFFNQFDFLEVETPILQPLYGGAAARPFKTHHNTLDMTLYLRIANELYLKRLIVGGFDGVYEFSKDFRNEGMSRFHNPEFTQVELYVAYKD